MAWGQLSPNANKKNILITNTVKTDQLKAVLSVYAPMGLQNKSSGAQQWMVLTMEHAPQWHTYWKNPGDAGLATQLSWKSPPGLEIGPTLWPQPERIALGELINFGYTGTSALIAPIRLLKPLSTSAADHTVALHASWLVCRQECIPQEGDFQVDLTSLQAQTSTQLLVDKVLSSQPQEISLSSDQARVTQGPEPDQLKLQLQGLPAALQGHRFDVLPEQAELLKTLPLSSIKRQQQWRESHWEFISPVSELRAESPKTWSVVLLDLDDPSEPPKSYKVLVHMSTPWPSAKPSQSAPAPLGSSPVESPLSKGGAGISPPDSFSSLSWLTLLVSLAGAFLGGLMLNLMPCVLPVLAIKALSFLPKASPREQPTQLLATFYALGIWVTLLALGGLILLLRAGGAQLGWGFQLQSPHFVVFLSVLFTLIALNLWGVFEVRQAMPSFLSNLGSKHQGLESFLSGALSVLIASPCTAPFMGASIGLAFSIPTWQGLLLFSMLALGLAFPILLMGWFPQTIKFIPRPGPWMMTFRASLGFPMAMTVVWLTWVLAQQVGIHAMAAQLMLLVVLSACTWAFSLHQASASSTPGRSKKVAWLLLVLWLALEASWSHWVLGPESQALNPTSLQPHGAVEDQSKEELTASKALTVDSQLVWRAWSKTRVREALDQGLPVFVDYTAAWCLSCQFNKVTFQKESVQQAFKAHQVQLFEADWTRQDPQITQSLNEMGRNGVPVYVLYNQQGAARFLSEFVTEKEILNALADL